MNDLNYPEEGGTRRTPLPPGYHHLHLAGPLVPVFQRRYARHLGRTLRRLTSHR